MQLLQTKNLDVAVERVKDNKVLLKKEIFAETLIENWISRELSQVLNSITIFQLTSRFTDS